MRITYGCVERIRLTKAVRWYTIRLLTVSRLVYFETRWYKMVQVRLIIAFILKTAAFLLVVAEEKEEKLGT